LPCVEKTFVAPVLLVVWSIGTFVRRVLAYGWREETFVSLREAFDKSRLGGSSGWQVHHWVVVRNAMVDEGLRRVWTSGRPVRAAAGLAGKSCVCGGPKDGAA
jgi:hypothetical protein